MSVQAAQDFLSKVESDPKVRQDVFKSVDDVVNTGAQHGYSFSSAELKKAMAQKWKTKPAAHGSDTVCAQYCCLYE